MVFTHMFKMVIFALSIFTAMDCQTGIVGGFYYGTDKTVVDRTNPTKFLKKLKKIGFKEFEHTPFGTVCNSKDG